MKMELMELRRCETSGKYDSSFYCKNGEVIDHKNCVLLGYYKSLPVLSNTMMEHKKATNLRGRKTFKVEVNSQTGEKFINLNGKKLKMLTELHLPGHVPQKAKVIQPVPIAEAQTPVNIKILGSISSLLKTPSKIKQITESQGKNTTESNVNIKTDNKINTLRNGDLSKKTKLISEKLIQAVKIPSNGRAIQINTPPPKPPPLTVLKSENVKLLKEIPMKTFKRTAQMDILTVFNKYRNRNKISNVVQIADKSFQTEDKTFADKEVQTEARLEVNPLSDLSIDDLVNYVNDETWPAQQPTMHMNNYVSSKNLLNLNVAPVPVIHQDVDKRLLFFTDLRAALQPDDKGNMPIHIGVLKNDINLIKRSFNVLKALRHDINLPNNNDLIPLQLAIINDCNLDILRFLLENGAAVDCIDSEGNTIFHLAIEYHRTNLLEELLKFSDRGNYKILDKFNCEGLTPIMMCCSNGLVQCAELLLEYGADVNVKDQKSGRTALFHAAERHDPQMVQILLTYHADTKSKNFFGTSPHDAMYEIDDIPEEIKLLILGKAGKRKMAEEQRLVKIRKREEPKKQLKTYARFQKVNLPKHIAAAK